MAQATLRSVAIELNNLAFLLHESKKYHQAAAIYREAQEVMEAHVKRKADPPKSDKASQKASIKVWKTKLSLHQQEVEALCGTRDRARSLDQMVDIYACQFEKIIRAIMRPITLHHDFSFPDDAVSMVLEHNIGIVLFLANKLDDAVENFQSAARRKEVMQDKKFSSIYLSIQCALGITYARLEKLEQALQALTVALTFRLKYDSNKNSSHAAMLQELGDFHGAMGSDGLAYTFFLGEMLVSCEHQPVYCGPQADCTETASAAA